MDKKEKTISGFDYLWLALYAAAGFAFELLLVQVEKMIGIDINHCTSLQMIVHWIITTFAWCGIGFLITWIGNKTTDFDIWKSESKRLETKQIMLLVVCFVINIVAKYLDWDGFKVLKEFQSRGPLLFVFQYIYYLAEGFLISLVIVYGQKACEKWFRNDKIPYGGIVLGLTWGLGHIVSKGSIWVGLLSMMGGFLFGAVYLIVDRDYKKTLPLATLLFIL